MTWSKTITIGGQELGFESGEIARQAGGAVIARQGRLVILATATAGYEARDTDFAPLTVEYRFRLAAGGRIPGSYQRREARATDDEVLTSRLIDRTLRPLIPDGFPYEIQVIISLLSHEPGLDPGPLCITAAAMALSLSDVPFDGPIAGLRMGLREGRVEPILEPNLPGSKALGLDLIVAAGRRGLVMTEGSALEASEAHVLEAFRVGQEQMAPLLDAADEARAARGRPKRPLVTTPPPDPAFSAALRERALPPLDSALAQPSKQGRNTALRLLKDELKANFPEHAKRVGALLGELERERIREGILAGRRVDGRGAEAIRPISARVRWLPTPHGSALFTRGETQAMVTCTLGSDRDSQEVESPDGVLRRRFLLHYNFPSYSVGEVKPLRGPGRREIGHGSLALRALESLLPDPETFPYTVRIESTISESCGSSSMATVCGGALALMDAGVPIARPVAGIAMGLVATADRFVVISDILGDEDHVGDMDFKVAGTERGITAIQLDNKVGSLPLAVMEQGLSQARVGRLHILAEMAKVLARPRTDLPEGVPRSATRRIPANRIRSLIGQGGKNIRRVETDSGATVNLDDDGFVRVFAPTTGSLRKALELIEDLTGFPKLGDSYLGQVTGVKPFGVFVRLFEGIEGLIQAEQIMNRTLQNGDRVPVKVTAVREGRIDLLLEGY